VWGIILSAALAVCSLIAGLVGYIFKSQMKMLEKDLDKVKVDCEILDKRLNKEIGHVYSKVNDMEVETLKLLSEIKERLVSIETSLVTLRSRGID